MDEDLVIIWGGGANDIIPALGIQIKTTYIVPPVFKYGRYCALVEIRPFELRVPECEGWCQYGDCDGRQCGGCCGCLGGCQVAWENQQIAPFLWEGDYA